MRSRLRFNSGKTLVGIVATTTVKKKTIIFCNTDLAIQQWEAQFKQYTDINPSRILKLSSKYLEDDKYSKMSKEA
jgi:superfamily II DNA or RNA helicase